MQGDSCDFVHPLAPSGALTNRVCDFFSTPRGCVKGDKCDFLHPKRLNPRGQPTTRVCDFFLTPQGCLKGNQCDFLHPRVIPAQHLPPGPAARGAVRGMGRTGPAGGITVRVCEFYRQLHSLHASAPASYSWHSSHLTVSPLCAVTPAGCNRGNSCQFLHPTGRAAQQALAAKEAGVRSVAGRPVPICDYFFSRRGCSKGDSCPFSHSRDLVAPYGGFAAAASPVYGAAGVQKRAKVCDFYGTERGCVKGETCEFIHVKVGPLTSSESSGHSCRHGALTDPVCALFLCACRTRCVTSTSASGVVKRAQCATSDTRERESREEEKRGWDEMELGLLVRRTRARERVGEEQPGDGARDTAGGGRSNGGGARGMAVADGGAG